MHAFVYLELGQPERPEGQVGLRACACCEARGSVFTVAPLFGHLTRQPCLVMMIGGFWPSEIRDGSVTGSDRVTLAGSGRHLYVDSVDITLCVVEF
jgi:hypothetical protein